MFRVVVFGAAIIVVVAALGVWRGDSGDALSNKHIWAALQIKYYALLEDELHGLPKVLDLDARGRAYRALVVDALNDQRNFALLLLDDDLEGRDVFWFPNGARFNARCREVAAIIEGEPVLPSVFEFIQYKCSR